MILTKIAVCLLGFAAGGSAVFAQSFAAPVDYATASLPYAAALGDFNGDGIRDLATANNSARSISVLLGTGVATFGAKTDYDLGSGPEGIVTMDLNGDGKLDLAEFGGASTSADNAARGRALRRVAENPTLNQNEKNSAFVLMQYFGYLRRNPNDPQDTDYSGYDFWLTKLNEHNGNYIEAEMVKAFLDSSEYRARFGP